MSGTASHTATTATATATAGSCALRTRQLTVRREGRQVLHGLDLDLPAARWTAVIGPNGAGKTTLLKSLAGLLPAQGQVHWLGQDPQRLSGRERGRLLAWMGQGEGLEADLRAFDVVMLARLPHQGWWGRPSEPDRAVVAQAMQRTGSWAWRDRPLGQLSAGERQRVLLARALAVQAPILLLDEPLTHLDPPHQADWLALVRAHVREGGTVVSVLHELNMALQADQLLLLESGRIRGQGPCADPAMHRGLEDLFGGRVQVHAAAGQWVALPRPMPPGDEGEQAIAD